MPYITLAKGENYLSTSSPQPYTCLDVPSPFTAVLVRADGWTLTANGTQLEADGRICWEYSYNTFWAKEEAAMDYSETVKQNMLEKGFLPQLYYMESLVLGQSIHSSGHEAAVYDVDDQGGLYNGFLSEGHVAYREFERRCERLRSKETRLEFDQFYPTHRIGRCRNWMVVEVFDGAVLCFMPSDEWDGQNVQCG